MNTFQTHHTPPVLAPVVVGVDGRPGSAGALRFAVAEAVRRHTPLVLVHVMPLGPWAPMAPMTPFASMAAPPSLLTDMREVATRVLEEARDVALDLAPGLTVRTELGHGTRTTLLVEAGQHARLLVLGRESRHGLDRLLTGTTTPSVAARAACDVVVVPPGWTQADEHGRVVVGVKSAGQAPQVLGPALAEASARGARLTVATAWQLPDPYLDRIELRAHAAEWESEGRAVVEEAVAAWRPRYPDVAVDVDVRHGRATEVLHEIGRDCDLLVVGRHRHPTHAHGHLGGVAHALISGAEMPVLVAPPTTNEEPAGELTVKERGHLVR